MRLRSVCTAAALAAALVAPVVAAGPAAATTTGTTQGCTPGYWKNHPASWLETPTQPIPTDKPLSTVFAATKRTGQGSSTMLQALSFRGGSGADGAEQILLRAAVASWLNSAHEGVAYPLVRSATLPRVNAALLSQDRAAMLALATELDTFNNLGCPLS